MKGSDNFRSFQSMKIMRAMRAKINVIINSTELKWIALIIFADRVDFLGIIKD